MASRYRSLYRNGKLYAEYVNGVLTYLDADVLTSKRSTLSAPHYMRDMGEYTSPIDGQVITSRSAHREHLKVHDVIEVGNERMPAAPEASTREIGETIKRHLEEVKALPQSTYDDKVNSNG